MSEHTDETRPVSAREIFLLGALGLVYLVQGLPYGLQVDVLPVLLRTQGSSFTVIALSQMLALPWILKVFVGPYMDAHGNGRLGRRKSFILPLQLGLATTMALAAFLPVERSLALLCVLILTMNTFAATMDVAVDGLMVDTLRARTLGLGNAMQVDGFLLGMIVSGGVLFQLEPQIGLRGMFEIMAGLTLFVHVLTWGFPEQSRAHEPLMDTGIRSATRAGWDVVRGKEARALVLFVLTYKAGEAIADVLFKPMLVDSGMSPSDIARIVGTYGKATSMIGPIVAGVLARVIGIRRALVIVIVLRVIPLGGELLVALGMRSHEAILAVTMLEHFIGSALTTLTFAMMMTSVDPRVGATQFTVLATLENLGKGTLGYAAGPLGDHLGLIGTYTIALAFTVAFAIFGPGLARRALASASA